MYQASFLITAGPCLIMALATLAMYILGSSLEQSRHARLWALSFALYTVGWAFQALLGGNPSSQIIGGLVGLFMTAALFCYFAGFLERRGRLHMRALVIAAAAAVLIDFALMFGFHGSSASIAEGLFRTSSHTVLFLAAAMLVTPGDREASATERSVTATLFGLGLCSATMVAVAAAQQIRAVSPKAFVYLGMALSTPTMAAMGLFTLMLIASDFSRERLRLIQTDPLTGVLNRAGFEERAERAIARAQRFQRAVTLILADIDRFKAINDRHGHLTGDAALKAFAGVLVDAVPGSSLVGRFGGEEFVMLIVGQGAAEAGLHAERARLDATRLSVPESGEVALTASFGVAELLSGESLLGLYARADAALYLSKEEGRNRTTLDPARMA